MAPLIQLFSAASQSADPGMGSGTATSDLAFWDRFLTSAGFGGLMAVVAASVAASIAYLQYRSHKDLQAENRWWDTLTWVYDRTIVENAKAPLPQTVTFSLLAALNDEVRRLDQDDALRSRTIAAILELFEDGGTGGAVERGRGASGEGLIRVTGPTAVSILERLRGDLSARGYISDTLVPDVYLSEVREALVRSTARHPNSLVREAPRDLPCDLLVRVRGSEVWVIAKYVSASGAIDGNRLVNGLLHQLPERPRSPTLLIANLALTESAQKILRARHLRHVKWASTDDDAALAVALRKLVDAQE